MANLAYTENGREPATVFDEDLPPGTQRIEDLVGSTIVLSPIPSSNPNQALNWSTGRKALQMTLLMIYSILVFAILTVALPLWTPINLDTGVSINDLNDAYASSSGTLCVGCIIFIPVALKFGRRPVYVATSLLMTVAAIWQARAHTTGDFIGANVIMGLAGCVNEALFQVTVRDLFFAHQRASALGLYGVAVVVGNYLGPVAAGYVANAQGWRWVFYYLTIFQGVLTVALIFLLEETKFTESSLEGQPLSHRDTRDEVQDVQKDDKKRAVPSSLDPRPSIVAPTPKDHFLDTSIPLYGYRKRHSLYRMDSTAGARHHGFFRHIWQPFEILVQFPAVGFAALQYAWQISLLSILAVTQAILYPLPPYNFSPGAVGLMNLPPAIGAIIGSIAGGPPIDFFSLQVAKRRQGIHEPEVRLWPYMIPGCFGIVGALMFGLTIARGDAWIINAIGAGFIGFFIGGCGDLALVYIQDCYQEMIGDALVGVVFCRNALATGLIFAIPPWITSMGVYNMYVVVGCLTALVTLTCVPFFFWGRTWRVRLAQEYRKYAARQY